MNDNDCKYFVQYMLEHGVSKYSKALAFASQINSDLKDRPSIEKLVSTINREIQKDGFKILFAKCEVTEEDLIIWLNTKNDILAKAQNSFSPIELEYFQTVMKEIVMCPEHKLPHNLCLHLSSNLTGSLTKVDSGKLLEKWIKGGYFVLYEGSVYLGARCINEFASYFRESCADYMKMCSLCSEAVFVGNVCGTCYKAFHRTCLNKFLKRQKNCPSCHNKWSEAEAGMSQSTDDTEAEVGSSQSTEPGMSQSTDDGFE